MCCSSTGIDARSVPGCISTMKASVERPPGGRRATVHTGHCNPCRIGAHAKKRTFSGGNSSGRMRVVRSAPTQEVTGKPRYEPTPGNRPPGGRRPQDSVQTSPGATGPIRQKTAGFDSDRLRLPARIRWGWHGETSPIQPAIRPTASHHGGSCPWRGRCPAA